MVLTPKDHFEEEYDHFKKKYKFKEKELTEINEQINRIVAKHEKDSADRMEELKAWLSESHFAKDIEINNFELLQQGRFSSSADLVFKCEMQTGDLVKTVGDYLILEAGKFIGRNINLSPNEKERENDIYMPCPRQNDWVLTIDIPEGYTIENVHNLNYLIENSTIGFSNKAEINDGKVMLTASNYYLHDYHPWPIGPKCESF